MTEQEVRAWHEANGVPYIAEDWGERDPETGEGLENVGNDYWGEHENTGRVIQMGLTPGLLDWLDGEGIINPAWSQRGLAEREKMEALEEFFAPYLSQLTYAKGNLILQYMGERQSLGAIGKDRGVSRQAIHKQLRTALRMLTKLVAEDHGYTTARPRNYGDESRVALEALNEYWKKRFGFGLMRED